jgi:hypothetical protein
VSDNRVLRKIFGSLKNEVMGCWRNSRMSFAKFYQDDQIKEDEMDWACGAHGKMRKVCRILVRKPKGKRPLGRTRDFGRIILKCILGNGHGGCGLNSSGSL